MIASFVKMAEIWSAVTTAAKLFIHNAISLHFSKYHLASGLAVNVKQHVSITCIEMIQNIQVKVCSRNLMYRCFLKIELTRAFRCGECDACTRPNCGHCTYCLDMKRFGGPNIKKQACIHKRCQNKRYAPPTRVTPE